MRRYKLSLVLLWLFSTHAFCDVAVVGNDSGNILIYSDSGEYQGVFSEMYNPVGIAVGPNGDVFVSHGASQITRFSPDGTEIARLDDRAALGELAFGPDGFLYSAASSNSDAIGRYDVSNGGISSVGNFVAPGSGPSLAFGPDHNLYVANAISGEVLRYSGDTGEFVDVFAISAGNGASSLTFGPDDNLYVLDDAHGAVERYDGATGAFVDLFAKPGFILPRKLAFGPDGHLYVSGKNYFPNPPARKNMIERFDGESGEFINRFIENARYKAGTVDDFPLDFPTQFVFGEFAVPDPPPTIDLMVGISRNRLVSFDPTRGRIQQVHAVLPFDGALGLAVDTDDPTIYALSGDHRLYTIDPVTLETEIVGLTEYPEVRVPGTSRGRSLQGAPSNLGYDPNTGTLYTTITYSDFFADNRPFLTDLAKIDSETAEVTIIGRIADDAFVTQLGWSEQHGSLVGLFKDGFWSPNSVVSISPEDATMETLFETPYPHMNGMAPDPSEPGRFMAWVNADGYFYGEVDLNAQSVERLGDGGPVRVEGGMQFLTFDIATAEIIPEPITGGAWLGLLLLAAIGNAKRLRSVYHSVPRAAANGRGGQV